MHGFSLKQESEASRLHWAPSETTDDHRLLAPGAPYTLCKLQATGKSHLLQRPAWTTGSQHYRPSIKPTFKVVGTKRTKIFNCD